jgi:hypothetical protein
VRVAAPGGEDPIGDRWVRLGVVGSVHRPAFGSIVSPPDRLGWRHGAGAVYCSDGGDPAARDRGNNAWAAWKPRRRALESAAGSDVLSS